MMEDLKAFLHHLPCETLVVTLLSANSKSIQNSKQKLVIWTDTSSPEISKF